MRLPGRRAVSRARQGIQIVHLNFFFGIFSIQKLPDIQIYTINKHKTIKLVDFQNFDFAIIIKKNPGFNISKVAGNIHELSHVKSHANIKKSFASRAREALA